jgi:hypothetical protein
MIGNLVANAVRYTSQGGILIGARRHGERVRIEVWDTGIGIDEAHLPYLFHEFYQVGNPERDSAKGLGLGLSIVARLAEILDHPVEVLSKPGRGSVFSVSVPVAVPLPLSPTEPPPGLPFRPSIMVRLQDIDRCGDICGLLDAWGYERHCACSDGELASLLDDEPAAIICDGTTLPAIAAHLPGRGTPPLLVTIDQAGGDAAETTVAVDAHLSLPFRPARLRALLHHLLVEVDSPAGQ